MGWQTEWDALGDPEAVKRVFASKIDIQMVGLESTEEIPLTREHDYIGQVFASFPQLIGQG
ncbi:hypothetical protein H5S09_09705 [Limosilactobacillus sp. STM2_1]|uniref:Uncharacterized protein n=1 Tax=Limosilactobacillus rudii TaxID=2759755 RepID=A0A7W3YNI9_9LACO|nr:hypothetical protein [Limosilactobacillus rudii]MBB1078916.1 hypothetical protein [Limosilactobacillus rudii]MBB1098208.1 hypothetical protein [Limosilactobacillus rudii]MCD7135677.1 hypothetical protein [Limosilactobacillus rudii]